MAGKMGTIRAKQYIHDSEARFQTMFETAAVGIGIMSLERQLMDANLALCKMFGMTRDEIIGKSPTTFTYPGDIESSNHQYVDLISGKQDYFWGERRYLRKNGDTFWASVTMSMVRDEQGEPLYIVGMLVDIDEQKVALAKSQDSEARFKAMFENSAVGMGLMGIDRKIIDSNPAMCTMLGRTREELIGQSPAIATYPEDFDDSTKLFKELLSGQRDYYVTERRYVRKNGDVFWARISMSLIRDENKNPLYLVGLINDIDEQKRAAEHLRESEARFRAMYHNAAVGMAMMSLDRKIISINQTAARMTGYSLDELYNSDPTRLSYPDDMAIGMDSYRDMVSGLITGYQAEKRFIKKNGDVFWGRVTYSIVPDLEGKPEYVIGVIEDVTEKKVTSQKLAEQESEYRRMLEQRVEERTYELAEANLRLMEEIEQRERVEEELAAKAAEEAVVSERTRLARELHDAVTQTLFASSLIAEVLPELWETNIDEAKKSTEELRQLTRGALAEMRTLLLELRPATLTQSRLTDLIKQLCEALIGRSRLPIHLVMEGDRPLPPEVQIAFYRIAQESLNNVFKYARATQVNVNLYLTPAGVHLDICDNGNGFDPSNVKPTSLGMRIMRERADAVGAQLSITSEPGKGVCVDLDWVEKPDMKLSVFKR